MAMPEIRFEVLPGAAYDTAVICVYEGGDLSEQAAEMNRSTGGKIAAYLAKNKSFKGKAGETVTMPAPDAVPHSHLVILGLGVADKMDSVTAETAGGKLYLTLKSLAAENVCLYAPDDKKEALLSFETGVCSLITGLTLRAYHFGKYKKAPEDDDGRPLPKLEVLSVVSQKDEALRKAFAVYKAQIEGVYWARDLVNEPPNHLYPDSFAHMVKDTLKPLNVEVEIFDEKKMEKLGFQAHLAVGMGSSRPPRVVIMRWNGAKSKDKSKSDAAKPLAFVGKGVTFDTGGVNLKPSAGMEDMKLDMGGAATVVGLMKALALRKAPVDVVGIIGLAENMPSDTAYRPSDIIGSLSGKTIEVMNTDAEGRLVLADCLTYVQDTYDPSIVIDLATLTGAMMVALGYEYCGTFVNQDSLWHNLESASRKTGEKLWRMPLDKAYKKEMDSTVADLRSLGSGRMAGACTAAGFLENFIHEGRPWAHMDIAGTAWIAKDSPICPKPGTGFGVRVLDRMIADHYEGE